MRGDGTQVEGLPTEANLPVVWGAGLFPLQREVSCSACQGKQAGRDVFSSPPRRTFSPRSLPGGQPIGATSSGPWSSGFPSSSPVDSQPQEQV